MHCTVRGMCKRYTEHTEVEPIDHSAFFNTEMRLFEKFDDLLTDGLTVLLAVLHSLLSATGDFVFELSTKEIPPKSITPRESFYLFDHKRVDILRTGFVRVTIIPHGILRQALVEMSELLMQSLVTSLLKFDLTRQLQTFVSASGHTG